MLGGLGIVLMEWRTSFILSRLGQPGRVVILICGVFFSVWGLKEIISGVFPSMRRSALGRHRFRMPIEGQMYLVIMFVLFVGSIMGRSNPLILVFSLMAAPYIVNGWLTFILLKKLEVERRIPDRVMAGDAASIEVVLRNRKIWFSAWLMTLIDRVSNARESLEPTVLFPRVPPRWEQVERYTLRLVQRGVYTFGPIQIVTRFPLGLVERGLNLDAVDQILVYPRIGRLTADWQDRLSHAEKLMSTVRPRAGLFNDEFHKLRDYRTGDDVRAIHWKTSARRDELMVRQFQVSRNQELAILLDAWLPESATTQQRLKTELAISLAATMCVDQARYSRDSLPLFAANGHDMPAWGGSAGSHRLESLMDSLARLTPGPRVDAAGLVESVQRLLTSRHRVVFVTPRPKELERQLEEWTSRNRAERGRLLPRIEIVDPESEQAQSLVHWD